jgi:hypothetical protein
VLRGWGICSSAWGAKYDLALSLCVNASSVNDQPIPEKEHIWPDWLLEHLRGSKRKIVITGNFEGRPIPGITITPGLRVKSVCNVCNGGWMNDLENLNFHFLQNAYCSLYRTKAGYTAVE